MAKRVASVDKKRCVACGVCENTCPLAAAKVYHGCYAVVEETVCVGCGKCAKSCPAGCIEMKEGQRCEEKRNIGMIIYGYGRSFILHSVFNILFAWFGMIDFLVPLGIAIFGGNKFFCNYLCGRGQLFSKLGGDLKCSRNKPTPRWMSSKWFRYVFLIFFLTMFGNMVFQTYLVGAGVSSLREAIKRFRTFRVP